LGERATDGSFALYIFVSYRSAYKGKSDSHTNWSTTLWNLWDIASSPSSPQTPSCQRRGEDFL